MFGVVFIQFAKWAAQIQVQHTIFTLSTYPKTI